MCGLGFLYNRRRFKEAIHAIVGVVIGFFVGEIIGAADEYCLYSVTGNPLPDGTGSAGGCGSTNYSGTGTGQCYYRFERMGGATGTSFNIYARSFGIADSVFKYTNTAGAIVNCAADSVNQGAAGC